ncbi:hypothetical protein ACQWFV_25170, partial [Salmonella enterica subsp. enterica serovar Infantis]
HKKKTLHKSRKTRKNARRSLNDSLQSLRRKHQNNDKKSQNKTQNRLILDNEVFLTMNYKTKNNEKKMTIEMRLITSKDRDNS